MSKLLWQVLKFTPAVLGASLLATSASFASEVASEELVEGVELNSSEFDSSFEVADSAVGISGSTDDNVDEMLMQINDYNGEETSLDQVNSVSQLTDIDPFWFEAVQKMVDKYGCIVGYPDQTFRGQRNITRYEFAAALSRCMDYWEERIGTGMDGGDIETLRRLVQEFSEELAVLEGRVDDLEGRVGFLEDNQFSTTTKLKGEVIFDLAAAFGDEQADASVGDGQDIENEITFADRVRLTLDTSFTGRDRLRTRLQAGNIDSQDGRTGTDMARVGYTGGSNNDVALNRLYYRTPVGDNLSLTVGPVVDEDDLLEVTNSVFASGGSGALSRFHRRNPAVHRFPSDQGAALTVKFSDAANLQLAYATQDGEDPTEKNGIFNNYTALAQLNLSLLEDRLGLSATYGRGYYPGGEANLSGSTGSGDGEVGALDPFGQATSANRFGIQADFNLTNTINFGGWVGYVDAENEITGDDADIWNWTARIGFKDLGGEGNVLGLLFGMPPKLTDSTTGTEDPDTGYILEAQYRYKLSNNVLLTPGILVILNPDHNENNDTVYVGILRTTFTF